MRNYGSAFEELLNRCVAEGFRDAFEEGEAGDGAFEDEVLDAEARGVGDERTIGDRCEDDYRNALPARILAHRLEDLNAVHARHH